MFCLSRVSEEKVTNREEKELLQRAGLGRLEIKFNATGSTQTFKEDLDNTFPKLMCGWGFELLKRLPGNNLEVIPPPAIGYIVEYLKKCGIGQSMLFIRPIQCYLDVSPETDTDLRNTPEAKTNTVMSVVQETTTCKYISQWSITEIVHISVHNYYIFDTYFTEYN